MLGGAFDPPHRFHVDMARAAMEQLGLDELRIVPTGDAWHKRRVLSPARHRLAMAALAFGDVPGAVVDDLELHRDGPTYTVDTLSAWRARWPEADLFLCIGADQSQLLHTWHRWRDLLDIATVCIAERQVPSGAAGSFDPLIPSHTGEAAGMQAAGSLADLLAPAVLQAARHARHLPRRLAVVPNPVSATQIRAKVAAGEPIDTLVSPAVARYIDQHQLYRTPDETTA